MFSTHCLCLSSDKAGGLKRLNKKGSKALGSLALGDILSVDVHTRPSAGPTSCLYDSEQRWVLCGFSAQICKECKLDKDQHSGHTESHKDVQCLGAEGSRRAWRKGMGGREKGERAEGTRCCMQKMKERG